jgi:hypothetical protein
LSFPLERYYPVGRTLADTAGDNLDPNHPSGQGVEVLGLPVARGADGDVRELGETVWATVHSGPIGRRGGRLEP